MDIYYLVCGIFLMVTGNGFIALIPYYMTRHTGWAEPGRLVPGICIGVMGTMQIVLATLVIIVATRPVPL